MGMLVVVGGLAFVFAIGAMFVHAVRTSETGNRHGWLVVVPLLIVLGWLLETIIVR